jgi:hypothetical protein
MQLNYCNIQRVFDQKQELSLLAEKQHIPILYSFVWQDRGSYPQSIALEASKLTITLPMRFPIFILFLLFF